MKSCSADTVVTSASTVDRDAVVPGSDATDSASAGSEMLLLCAGCDGPILDRFLLNVLDRVWHAKCVQCCECGCPLADKCFARDGRLFCRQDFFRYKPPTQLST